MILNLKIEGEENTITSALTMFCTFHGWTLESGIEQISFAETVIKGFIRQSIDAQAIAMAKLAAEQAAKDQIAAALANVTTTLTEI